jgi:hypothetical protein
MDGIQRISNSFATEPSKALSGAIKSGAEDNVAPVNLNDSVERSSGSDSLNASSLPTKSGIMASISSGVTVAGAAELLMDRTFEGSMRRLWSCQIPEGLSSEPLITADGTVLCGTEAGSLVAIKDGKREWELKLGDEPLTSPVEGPDGMLHVSGKHSVYSVRLDDRDGVKTAAKEYECRIDEGEERISRPDAGPDGTVYVTTSPGRMHAIWKGKKKWSYRPKSFFNKGENSDWSGITAGADGTVYAGTQGGRVVAVKDGKELWSFKMRKVMQENMTGDDYYNVHDKPSCAPVIGPDGLVYVATDGGSIYALKNGKEQWSSFVSSNVGSLNVGPDGNIYTQGYSIIGTKFENSVYCVSKGDYKWNHTPSTCPALSSRAVMADGTLLVGTEKGITALSPEGRAIGSIDMESGGEDGRKRPQKAIVAPDDTVYVISDKKTLRAYSRSASGVSSGSEYAAESPGIEENDSWLVIDGVQLQKRKLPGEL